MMAGVSKNSGDKSSDFKKATMFIVAGVVISLVYVVIFAYTMTMISAKMTYDTTLAVKKDMLSENVGNMIIYLDNAAGEYKEEHPSASKKEVEDHLYNIAHERMHSEKYLDGSYMWVEKILNYDGGDNYAIRLIHPNLKDTEGDYLTTNEVNPMGIKAYEEELEGIKKDGSLYLTYEFKKLNSDDVTKKVTFSKLYKDYDWIICMGVNIDELEHYQDQAEENMQLYQIIVLSAIVATWIILLFVMFHGYRKSTIEAYEKRNRELHAKINTDKLTGAGSREFGDAILNNELEEFRAGKKNTLVLMMDVDYFKQFNDNYGHDVGDIVLKLFVAAVKECITDNDDVIRWGGDEFVVILQNITREALPAVGDKLLNAIRNITIEEMDKKHPVTTSMGFAYFEKGDRDVKEVLNRADEALYRAKEAGRDNWKV